MPSPGPSIRRPSHGPASPLGGVTAREGGRQFGSGTPLGTPYGNKELAFGPGARYEAHGWFAPPGVDLAAFHERGWL